MPKLTDIKIAHTHVWWPLVVTKSGIVYKCDCGDLREPKKWWRFW